MGLSDKEVIESRKKYGSNIISRIEKESFIRKYISSLGDPIIRILIIALGIKIVFFIRNFDWYETIGIVIAIFIASFISTISEYGSEKAFEKLQEDSSKIRCRVRRNGKEVEIGIDELVKNDIVLLGSGDKIGADGVIISGSISIDESSINGESKEISKGIDDKVFRGTVVYSGEAIIKITEVGDNTFYGNIALELQSKKTDSPLKIRLFKLAKIISIIGYICAFVVAFSYLFSVIVIKNNYDIELIKESLTNYPVLFGHILYALTLCVTSIVVCVPEGLPMMITLVLSSNMKKMLKNNVLVRKMVGIETAGNINILFTDKTGTLTKGKLDVIGIMLGNNKEFNSKLEIENTKIYDLVKMSFVANNSSSYNGDVIGGNSTDRAILRFIEEKNNYKIIDKEVFDSKKKYSKATILLDNKRVELVKGSPEIILDKCKYYYDEYGNIRILSSIFSKQVSNKALKGIRVLACRVDDIFLCLIFIKDEIKKESIEGLKEINKAHVKTIMITGDNKDTAISIGKEVGIYRDGDKVVTSIELNEMDDMELSKILPRISIVARALPSDKSRLVKLSQKLGYVVGMTGDGVNDAPALKLADVGFSMGSGTEVAKEASDIVILDDNLLSISKAILFGRTIFKSIRKFIIFQLTVNLCAVSLSIVGPFIGFETPVTVIQMLWINMVMDTLAGLAFSFEPPLEEYMDEEPKNKNESIINRYMIGEILFTGIYSSLLCIFYLKSSIISSFYRNYDYFITGFFGLFIFMSIFNAFNARTHRLNIFANIKNNKVFLGIIILIVIIQIMLIYFGGNIFRTIGLNIKEFMIMVLISISVIPVDFGRKLILRFSKKIDGV